MPSKAALRVAEQTGCLPAEAEAALEVELDEARATEALQAVLRARRALYKPKLTELWARYTGSPTAEEMGLDETIQFVQDLGLELENPLVLAVVYELQAPRVGVLALKGFVDGWARLEASTLEDMKSRALPDVKGRFESDEAYFRQVYRFTFGFNLDEGVRTMPVSTATAYWELLLVPRHAIAANWVRYISSQPNTKRDVSADTWNMVLELCEFAEKTDPGLTQYDDAGAWPMVIDDFVDWFKKQGTA